jgi:hypothetical protein
MEQNVGERYTLLVELLNTHSNATNLGLWNFFHVLLSYYPLCFTKQLAEAAKSQTKRIQNCAISFCSGLLTC